MEPTPNYVGIDIAKAHLDVGVLPWVRNGGWSITQKELPAW
jgi:hypothetical protein